MGQDPERDSATTEHDEVGQPPSERKSATAKPLARMPEIPRAPALPNFTTPPDAKPSYAPESLRGRSEGSEETAPISSDARDTIRHISSEPFGLEEPEGEARVTYRSPPPELERAGRKIWDPAEIEVLEGKRSLVIERFERAANRSAQGVGSDFGIEDLTVLATLAAGFFTMAPVFRHFAPFDLSLFSIARVDAALDLVYGRKPRPDVASDPSFAQLLLGAYVGECLRQAYGGEWHGSRIPSVETTVDALGRTWLPFEVAKDRLERGRSIRFAGPEAVHPAAEPFGQRHSIPLSPPTPWDPDPWPSRELVPRLGLAFSHSIVSMFCSEFGEGPLDRSVASLAAVDAYLALLAPAQAPRADDATWLRRASLLVGAYLGEVLCDAAGARWQGGSRTPSGAEDYGLVLPKERHVAPVSSVYERLRRNEFRSLRDYASELTG